MNAYVGKVEQVKRKENSISSTLKRYYLSFALLTFVMAIIACVLSYLIGMVTLGNYKAPRLSASEVAQPDYKGIDSQDIQKLNGWVEIVHDNQVVYTIGDKKDEKLHYSERELNYPQNGYGKKVLSSFNYGGYSCSTSIFTGSDGKEYICLVKIPVEKMEKSLGNFLDFNNPLLEMDRLTSLVIVEGIGIFSLLFILCVLVYTKRSSRRIKLPLKAISHGIERMSSGDYTARLDFEGESEFGAIRDVFNYMAERLERAETEKREMEESKKNMIMGISHDLKTPITTVYGYAKALNDGMVEDEDRRRKYLQYICDKALNLTKLIDGLFEYAKLDSGKYQLKLEDDDFSEFIRELIAANFIEISNKGFQLELDIPEYPILYRFDRNEMMRAVMNILSNSLKYNLSGTTLGISVSRDNHEIVLKICDDGAGISRELKDRIFNEFVRGSTARVSDGGSGLGLTITKRIVEMHGGSVEIDGDTGKGSTFTIHLPFIKKE